MRNFPFLFGTATIGVAQRLWDIYLLVNSALFQVVQSLLLDCERYIRTYRSDSFETGRCSLAIVKASSVVLDRSEFAGEYFFEFVQGGSELCRPPQFGGSTSNPVGYV